ncbi:hypothetical protein BD311DRAFT_799404 [Dichomitus squalens]|uniref:Mid2 domain-containing protein n=1 Tax=Dichomitus squalens TaxID=114155 RepID=A0A4Q9MBI8_9APHY|nr:hypothetical protein BD311DRAFT_799404 [Dichomitus squalens]
MAASNVTIDDSSPLILYDPASAWSHQAGSDNAQGFVNGTHSSSDVEGATAKFSFTGTGFWVYGTKKANYGQYLLMLDNDVQLFGNATASPVEFGQVLGGTAGLSDGLHTVVLMAAGGGPVDIDAVIFETTDGQQGDPAGTQTASAPAGSQTAGRISANPHAIGGPNAPVSGQDASQTATASSADPSATGQPSTQPNAQPNAQPNGQQSSAAQTDAQATGQQGTQPTAQPNAQPNANPNANASDSGSSPTSAQPQPSSTTSAPGSSISQAEQANRTPQIAGTSQAHKGLPLGAIIGIAIGAAILLLLVVALVLFLLRRRRRASAARRRMTAGLPSPTLPLQDPEGQTGYFFGGYGNGSTKGSNPMREKYLATKLFPTAGARPISQESFTSGGRTTPYSERNATPQPLEPAVLRDSVHTNGYDVAEAYSQMPPTRPPRPPEMRLSGM